MPNVAGRFSRFFGSAFLVLALQGVTVCQDDTCATRLVNIAQVGQQLRIHCETECSGQRGMEWGQLDSDEPVNSNGRNLIVQNILNDSIGGRVYWCRCSGSDHRECHLVLVKPYIFDFAAEPIFVAVGQRFNLTCRAGGYPRPEQLDFHLTKHVPVPNVDISNVATVHVQSGVLATFYDVSVDYSGNYTCLVNTNYSNDEIDINMQTNINGAKVTVYDPPKLRGIKNFSAISEDTEQSAVLECTIEKTLAASVVLEWRRNGTLLQNSPKYVFPAPALVDNSNLLVYVLVVRELAASDMGAYECWLYSNYSFLLHRPENVLQVWILESGGPCTTPEPTTEGIKECNCNNSSIVVAVLGVIVALFILAAVVALIYFGCTRREQCTRGVSHSHSEGEVQQNETSDLGDRTNGMNQQQSPAEEYGGDSESDEVDPEASSLLNTSSARNPLQNVARSQESLQAEGAEQSLGQKATNKQRRVSFQHSEQVNIRRRSKGTGDDAEVLLKEQSLGQKATDKQRRVSFQFSEQVNIRRRSIGTGDDAEVLLKEQDPTDSKEYIV